MKRLVPIVRVAVLAVLFGVGSVLAQKQPKGITSQAPQANAVTINTGAASPSQNSTAQAQTQPFLAQLLKTLELGGKDEAFFGIHDVAGPVISDTGTETQNSQNPNPQAQAIADYLAASSAIGGTLSQNNIGAALSLAARGEPAALATIAGSYRIMRTKVTALTVPPELSLQHDATLQLLDRFANFLDGIATQPKDAVQRAWASPERDAVVADSKKLQEEIRTIVNANQVVLPAGVLP